MNIDKFTRQGRDFYRMLYDKHFEVSYDQNFGVLHFINDGTSEGENLWEGWVNNISLLSFMLGLGWKYLDTETNVFGGNDVYTSILFKKIKEVNKR